MAKQIYQGSEVLIEIQQVGNAVKVIAIDPATGIEVSMVGAPNAGLETLKRTAARKLHYVLKKRREEESARRGNRGTTA